MAPVETVHEDLVVLMVQLACQDPLAHEGPLDATVRLVQKVHKVDLAQKVKKEKLAEMDLEDPLDRVVSQELLE